MQINKVFFRLMKIRAINTFIEILRDNFEDSDDEEEEKLTPYDNYTKGSTTKGEVTLTGHTKTHTDTKHETPGNDTAKGTIENMTEKENKGVVFN